MSSHTCDINVYEVGDKSSGSATAQIIEGLGEITVTGNEFPSPMEMVEFNINVLGGDEDVRYNK